MPTKEVSDYIPDKYKDKYNYQSKRMSLNILNNPPDEERLNNAIERLKSELVLALAIVHHLVFRQQLTFEEIIGQIRLFCEKYLIIEFVDKEDSYLSDFKLEGFEWYTKENFESILKRQFEIIQTKPSTPSETRQLYFCKLK